MKIYAASSWRNKYHPGIVQELRRWGYEVYDFRNPRPGDNGFNWSEIDERWKAWTPDEYRAALDHPVARSGFRKDHEAMEWADCFVVVLPCGRSAHLEAGWACGRNKPVFFLILEPQEPELMYLEAVEVGGKVCTSVHELLQALDLRRHR